MVCRPQESEPPLQSLMSLEKGSPSPPAIPSPNSGPDSGAFGAVPAPEIGASNCFRLRAVAKSAVFIDLDRTLLCHASGQVLNQALVEEGVLPPGRSLPGDKLLYALNDRLGENLFSMGLVRAAARLARGWRQDEVQAAGRRAVSALSELVAPFAPQRLAAFRAGGHRLVLSTTTPVDMIAPFAEAFGFDDLIATAYETKDGRYTGRLYEGFVWGTGKLRAVREWAGHQGIDLADCHACSDSIFDVPLLSSVGWPHAVNPDPSLTVVATARRWPVEHWDRPPGVPSVVGLEPYHLLRPFVRKLSFPYAALRHRGCRQRAHTRPGAAGVEPPQLLRRRGVGPRRPRDRATGALPRQEGDLRGPGGRDHRAGHRRHRGRPGQRIGSTDARRRGSIEGRRSRHRPPAGHHPTRVRLLRSGAARQDRDGAAGRGDRRHCRAGRARGAPRTSGPARPACPTSPSCATRPP